MSFPPLHFSTWSLFISCCHRVGASIETSALFIGLSQRSGSTAACLHCRLSPVCEKRLCLYLQFLRAADIHAPPSPHHHLIPASGDSSRSTGGGSNSSSSSSVEDLPECCPWRGMFPNLPVESQPPQTLFWTLSGKDRLLATVLITVINHSGAWAPLQVRTPSWYWRLHEIANCDLRDHLYSQSWSLNDNEVSIFCLHRERGHIRFHRPPWIITFPPLLLQKNGWSPANLVQHLKRMPSWHPRSILLLAFWCSICLRLSGCCFYLLCSRELRTHKKKQNKKKKNCPNP